MKSRTAKIIQLSVCVGICLTLLIVCLFLNQHGAFGAFSLLGTIFFFLAFAIFNTDSALFNILRVLFIILGIAIIVPTAGLTTLFYISEDHPAKTGLWQYALGGPWLLNGLLSLFLYSQFSKNDTNEWMYPFVPAISFIVSYLLYVGFAYLGKNIHNFFYGYPGLILCVASVVFAIKNRHSSTATHHTASPTTYTPPETTDEPTEKRTNTDTRKDNQYILGKKIKDAIYEIKKETINFSGGYAEWRSLSGIDYYDKIHIDGAIKYTASFGRPFEDIANDAENCTQQLAESLSNHFKYVLDEVREEYTNYDHIDSIEVNLETL